eukprot:Gregarina_sp_Poly_1__7366@NODE_406_length_8829_cov_87_468500_g330_i0_p1_GENE_NODE_406_length_8829_cov_87_468500_g330_i0NODE_406_length_8829_cov_87_468500_g330_i0_p1_ORF_typecomplete_len1057_score128_54Ank_5/PF13857_6/1_1e08Ank_5/PF13857_6/4_6e07Ank_2/PF12796_7/7_7e07Ank_2/PF12796_7/3_3e08Ank_4/PF13637_6/2e05Ank_4/PF13637_6/0_00073Ank_4/PF13637_6/0_48Ank/PF00023_30/0_00034Ank/PF00023_30/3_9e02Ank/PF00023_30/0_00022Ank_3/PF13606_6/9_8e05Ank_3/PF13606_6/0_0013Tweety/PF04906_13/0_2Tweety/PF04906_13/
MKIQFLSWWLVVVTAALINVSYAEPEYSLQAVDQDLQNAESAVRTNTQIACQSETDLNTYGKNKITTGPISWCLLRAVSALTPGDSWAELDLLESGFLKSFQEIFKNYSAKELMKWMVWGVVWACVGAAWLLVFVFLILPLLWCRCWRDIVTKDADLRKRTSRKFSHWTFLICWILALAFAFGLVYYTVWLKFDVNAAVCKPMKTAGDLFGGVVKNNHMFIGLSQAHTIVTRVKYALELASTSNHKDSFSPIILDLLTTMWTITSSFSFAWNNAVLTDAKGTNRISSTDFAERWGLQLMGNLPGLQNQIRFDDLLDLSQYGAIGDISVEWADINQTDVELTSISNSVSIVLPLILSDLSDSFRSFYNSLIDVVQTILREKDGRETWVYALLLIFAIPPVFGVIVAYMLFSHQSRTKSDFTEQASSRQRRFAGFMAFGYAFWGIILFIGGGALVGLSYFPSDACRIIDRLLDGNDLVLYRNLSGFESLQQQTVNKCWRRDATGELVEALAFDDASALNTQIELYYETVTWALQLLNLQDKLTNGVLPIPQPYPYVVPVLPCPLTGRSPLVADFFRTGLDYEEVPLSKAAIEELKLIDTDVWGQWFTDDNHTGFGGIHVLQEFLSQRRPECIFCVNPYCSQGAMLISPENILIPEWTEYGDNIQDVNKTGLLELLTAKGETIVDDNLRSKLEVCGPDRGLGFETWWSSLYILLLRGAVLYESWTSEGFSNGLDNIDGGPLFFRLRSRDNPFEGSESVPFSEWTSSFPDDFLSILRFHRSEDFTSFLTSESVVRSSLGNLRKEFQTAQQMLDCRAVSLSIEDIKDSLCDSLSGDVASMGTFAVLLGLLHLIAFVMCFIYWLARSRKRDKIEKEAAALRPLIIKDGVTEAQFFHACEVGDLLTVRKATKHYPPNSVVDLNYNNTPLHVAAYYGHVDITWELCEEGWDPNAFNFKRHTPFTACVANVYLDYEHKTEVITILRDHGAWIDVHAGDGDTPLMIASQANEPIVVALLLEWGADPLKLDQEYHWSSLRLAQFVNHLEVLELLKEASPGSTKPRDC